MYHDDDIQDEFTQDVEFDEELEVNELDIKMRQLNFTVTKYISMYDIKRAEVDWSKLSQKDKGDLLWNAGLDVKNYRYVTNKDEHVTIEGLRKDCVRFICEERSDKAWIETGLASGDAYLKHKKDPSLTRMIKQMEDCYLPSIIK